MIQVFTDSVVGHGSPPCFEDLGWTKPVVEAVS